MSSDEIRQKFIKYFEENGHLKVESSSLIPDEPTLLLTNSGMVQMMSYLLAQKTPSSKRACSVQKCFRTTDVDDVGKDGRHLTFFEMLGSWSFGDYFKKEAIPMAYNLLVDVFNFNKDKISVSVFKGERGISEDSESIKIWEETGIPKERIFRLGWEDNFWPPPGNEGPCGPCTEIYYDMLEGEYEDRQHMHMLEEKVYIDTSKECSPGCSCDRFLEMWNVVFMEYYKDGKGEYSLLPQRNVDTGAGLERMAAFLQNKKEVFYTDTLFPILSLVKSSLNLGSSESEEKSSRIIADHVRASVLLLSDGVVPSNEGRGYVLRKLIRRALLQVRLYEYQAPYLSSFVNVVSKIYENAYPSIKDNESRIIDSLNVEEEKFLKILNRAVGRIEDILSKRSLNGEDIFTLSDTYGVPVEVTKDILNQKGLDFDEKGYLENLEIQKERSRKSSSFSSDRKK